MNKNKIGDIISWVFLLPAMAVFAIMIFFGLLVLCEFLDLSLSMTTALIVITTGVVEFFLARIIAPKYKNTVAICACIITVVWQIVLMYGMMNFAY